MPRMSQSEYEAYKSRGKRHVPLLDALIDDLGASVAAGKEIQDLHVPIMKDLRARGWMFDYKDPTRRTGSTLGVPDFLVWADNGRFFSVECKTAVGGLSKDQNRFKTLIEALGHRYHVVRSMAGWHRVVLTEIAP